MTTKRRCADVVAKRMRVPYFDLHGRFGGGKVVGKSPSSDTEQPAAVVDLIVHDPDGCAFRLEQISLTDSVNFSWLTQVRLYQ